MIGYIAAECMFAERPEMLIKKQDDPGFRCTGVPV